MGEKANELQFKNNPDKYMGNSKYVKDTESWFAKQAQKMAEQEFGSPQGYSLQ